MEQYIKEEDLKEYNDFQAKYKKANRIIIYHSGDNNYECYIKHSENRLTIVTKDMGLELLIQLIIPSVELVIYGFVGEEKITNMSSFDNHDFISINNYLLTKEVLVSMINAGRFRSIMINPDDGFDSSVDYSRTKCLFRIPEHKTNDYQPIIINTHKLDIRTYDYKSLMNFLRNCKGCTANQLVIKCEFEYVSMDKMNDMIKLFEELQFNVIKLHMIVFKSIISLEQLVKINKFKSIFIMSRESRIYKDGVYNEGKLKKFTLVEEIWPNRRIIDVPQLAFIGQKNKRCV